MVATPFALGIDIGASQIKAVAVTTAGQFLHSCRVATHDSSDGWKTAVPSSVQEIEALLGKAAAVGVSSPGLAARNHESIAWMRGRLAATQGYNWTEALSRDHRVPVLNDAHAALLGEVWLGAAKGHEDVLLVTLGTGVGGAILSGGRLLEGHLGRAGHIGHITLDLDGPPDIVNTRGSLEDLIGEHTLPLRSNHRFQTTSELVAAARAHDEAAEKIWWDSIRALAAGLVSLINVVDPALIVIGGGISNAGNALFRLLHREMDLLEWRPTGGCVPVVPTQLGEWSGAYGAAKFAIDLAKGLTP